MKLGPFESDYFYFGKKKPMQDLANIVQIAHFQNYQNVFSIARNSNLENKLTATVWCLFEEAFTQV